jgi:hypothetical protein
VLAQSRAAIGASCAFYHRFHPAHILGCSQDVFDRRDEVFLHLFEQYGDVTFLVLLCGYKVRIATNPTRRTHASHFHVATHTAMHSGAVTTFAAVLFRATASRCAPSAPWRSSPRTGWSPAVPPRYALHIEPLHIITTAHEGTVQFQCWPFLCAQAKSGMNGTLPPTQTLEHMLLPSIQTSFNVEFQWNWVHITELDCVFLLSTQEWLLKDLGLQQRINAKCNLC